MLKLLEKNSELESRLADIRMLVLGAGIYHVSLLKEFRALKIITIAASYLPNDPGLQFADKGLNISSTSIDDLAEIIRYEGITHIITIASDANTFSQATLNRNFNFNGLMPFQVEAVSYKPNFFILLNKLQLPCPETETFYLSERKVETLLINNPSLIFKPSRGSGSNGIFRNLNELPKNRIGESYLSQRFLEGTDISGQAILENGKVTFIAFSEKWAVNGYVPFVHWISPPLYHKIGIEVSREIECISEAIEFKSGTISLDIRLCEEIPYIIDYSLRLSGNMLIEAINLAFNINLFRYHILQTLNLPRRLDSSISDKKIAAIIFGTGKVRKDLDLVKSKIEHLLFHSKIIINQLVWDNLSESTIFTDSRHRIGHALVSFENQEDMENIVNQIKEILELE